MSAAYVPRAPAAPPPPASARGAEEEAERWGAAVERVDARRAADAAGHGRRRATVGELADGGWDVGGACVSTERERDALVRLLNENPTVDDARAAVGLFVRRSLSTAGSALARAVTSSPGSREYLLRFVECGFVPPREVHAAMDALRARTVDAEQFGRAVKLGVPAAHLEALVQYVGADDRLEFVRRAMAPVPAAVPAALEAGSAAAQAAQTAALPVVLRRCDPVDVLSTTEWCSWRRAGPCGCPGRDPGAAAAVARWLAAAEGGAAALFEGRGEHRRCGHFENARAAARVAAFAEAAQSRRSLGSGSPAGVFAAGDGDTSMRRRVASFLVDEWSGKRRKIEDDAVRTASHEVMVARDGSVFARPAPDPLAPLRAPRRAPPRAVGRTRRLARAPPVDDASIRRYFAATTGAADERGIDGAAVGAAVAELEARGHSVVLSPQHEFGHDTAVAMHPAHPYVLEASAAAAVAADDGLDVETAFDVDRDAVFAHDATVAAALARADAFALVAELGGPAPSDETERAVARRVAAMRGNPAERERLLALALRDARSRDAERVTRRAVVLNAAARVRLAAERERARV